MTEVRVPRVYQLTQQPSYEDHLPLFKIESDNPLFLATTGERPTSSRYCLIPNKTQWDLVVTSKNYKVHHDSDIEEQTQRSC